MIVFLKYLAFSVLLLSRLVTLQNSFTLILLKLAFLLLQLAILQELVLLTSLYCLLVSLWYLASLVDLRCSSLLLTVLGRFALLKEVVVYVYETMVL